MRKQKTNLDGRFQPVTTACSAVNVSRNTLMKIAAGANAIVRFGRTVRIDMPVLFKYIELAYKD